MVWYSCIISVLLWSQECVFLVKMSHEGTSSICRSSVMASWEMVNMQGLKKMFISLQARQNFPPRKAEFPSTLTKIYLQYGINVFLYFFQSKSQNFPSRSLLYWTLFLAMVNMIILIPFWLHLMWQFTTHLHSLKILFSN